MRYFSNFFYLCAVVSLCAMHVAQNFAMKASENESMLKSWGGHASKKNGQRWNITSWRSNNKNKKCETPNGKPGYCIGIKRCPTLLKQVINKHAQEFLLASRCGSSNKVSNNPKVCCETDNFRNIISKNIVQEEVFPKSCGHQNVSVGSRIYGGRLALPHEYPWMALLLHTNQYGVTTLGCAGFLIHAKYVLTAAHCTHPNSIGYKGPIASILLGKHNIETSVYCKFHGFGCGKNTQVHEVAKVTTHPHYDSTNTGRYNDIAIIQLKEKAHLTDYVQPICLAKDDSQAPISYHVSGWGKTEYGTNSKVKMQVEIPPFDKNTCFQRYLMADIILIDSQICAGGEQLEDTCSGDSGGPLMFTDDEIWYASGIVSFGMGCGLKEWPGVYTNIVKFLPWIKSVIAQEQRR